MKNHPRKMNKSHHFYKGAPKGELYYPRHWLKVIHVGAALFLLIAPCSIWALRSDATQIAHFKADHVSFNENNGTTIYSGHVKMQQGTTHLTADEVIVYKDKEGNTNKSIAKGKPAHYITLPDDQKDPMDAFGDNIEYYPPKQTAIIIGNGNVIQSMNSLKGSYIIYDMVKQTVSSIPSADEGSAQSLTMITLQPWDLPGKKKE